MFSALKAFILLSVAATGALADTTTAFKLVATAEGANSLLPSIENAELTVDSTGDAIFTTAGSGATFFLDGSSVKTTTQDGTLKALVATPGGNATAPDTNVATFSAGTSSKLFSVSGGYLSIADNAFNACPAGTVGRSGDGAYVNIVKSGQHSLANCSQVQLVVACNSGTSASVSGTASTVQCLGSNQSPNKDNAAKATTESIWVVVAVAAAALFST